MSAEKIRPFNGILEALDTFETKNPNSPDAAIRLDIRYRTLTKSQRYRMGPYSGWSYGTRLVSDTDNAAGLRSKLISSVNGKKHDLHARQGEIIESVRMKLKLLAIGVEPKLFEYTRDGGTAISGD